MQQPSSAPRAPPATRTAIVLRPRCSQQPAWETDPATDAPGALLAPRESRRALRRRHHRSPMSGAQRGVGTMMMGDAVRGRELGKLAPRSQRATVQVRASGSRRHASPGPHPDAPRPTSITREPACRCWFRVARQSSVCTRGKTARMLEPRPVVQGQQSYIMRGIYGGIAEHIPVLSMAAFDTLRAHGGSTYGTSFALAHPTSPAILLDPHVGSVSPIRSPATPPLANLEGIAWSPNTHSALITHT